MGMFIGSNGGNDGFAMHSLPAEDEDRNYSKGHDVKPARSGAFTLPQLLEQEKPKTCEWTSNDEHDGCIVWVSSCGNAHILGAGGPEENEMKYCCYCGKPLVENDVLNGREDV